MCIFREDIVFNDFFNEKDIERERRKKATLYVDNTIYL